MGFEIRIPIEYSAMKTIVVKEVDSIIDEYTEPEIKESIETVNEWAKVAEIFKFSTTSKMIKVQFTNTGMANRAVKEGIIILNQRIPARRVEREIFVNLKTCNNCYKYDHDTKNCTMEKQTLCAYCGEKGHKQSECLSMTPKCINCGDPHRTLAAQCPIRKGLIKTKRKEVRQRSRSRSRSQLRVNTQTTTEAPYAEMAAGGAVPKRRTEQINVSCEPEMKRITTIILSSIVYSQYKEMTEPGTFQQNMDTMFKENGLQKVKFPKQTNIQGMKEL